MLTRACLLLFLLSWLAAGALVKIQVTERSDVLGGKPFGQAGPYERIIGKAFFAVDPRLPANRMICDIDKASRNAAGLVEFSSDLYVLKPRDSAKGNHALLYEVSNRGRKGTLAMFNQAVTSLDPRSEKEFGDGFLMKQGFTLVWLGWQPDPPRDDKLVRLYAPVAKDGNRPIRGLVRAEFVLDKKEYRQSLADRNHIPYTPVNPDDPKLTLTVRNRIEDPRKPVPRSDWHIENGTHIVSSSGFEPGKIYELVYTAQDPVLVGLGPAAVRDLMSFLKHNQNITIMLGDQAQYIKHAYGFGTSQSGRFLRTFLYYGFNQDEKNQRVFDGVFAHVAGGGRGSFNHRFAQPSRDAHPFMNFFYPTDIFPFSDLDQTDPETRITDGLLRRAEKAGITPKIFYTNSAYEYYGRAASLIHAAVDASKDMPLAPNTRIYMFAGSQHGPAGFPPRRSITQNLPNPTDFRWSMRALLMAMHRWVSGGVQPPASQFPRIADQTAVPLEQVRFPKIPGVAFPTRMHLAYRADYGPGFRTVGIVANEPPKIGKPFPMRVPQVDRDGNDTSGIRMPEVQVPLATFTGWNLRTKEIGAPEELSSMVGSFIPFPRTKAEREKRGDPRVSIEERYPNKQDYLRKIEASARELARKQYLLGEDVPTVVKAASGHWDYLHSGK